MSVPNHRERQLMQHLRGRSWVNAIELPQATVTLGRMIEKRWIDKRDTGGAIAYRITDEGMEAKTTPIYLRRSRLGLG
jgi:hypothetical protein